MLARFAPSGTTAGCVGVDLRLVKVGISRHCILASLDRMVGLRTSESASRVPNQHSTSPTVPTDVVRMYM